MIDYVVGVDVGSTSVKMLAARPDGTDITVVSRRTPWVSLDGGQAELDAATIIEIVLELCRELDATLAGRGHYRVAALGSSGMAEAGVVLDSDGAAQAPVMAWFDPRGAAEIQATPPEFREQFPGTTGLPVGPIASLAKLLYLRSHGVDLARSTFVNLPEFVAHVLGGRRVAESSLVSRTGLIDQDTGEPWPEALAVLGRTDTGLLGDRVEAGDVIGVISHPLIPAPFRGALITTAGHDHLVSAAASGAIRADQLYDSIGTAEALVQITDAPLGFAGRARLASLGITVGRYPLPGLHSLLGATKSGLIMRRVLQLVGVGDANGRTALDEAVMALPDAGSLVPGALEVRGGVNTDGVLHITARSDDLSPAELFLATLRHGNELCVELLTAMAREVPAPTSAVVTGGWSSMRCVVRARSHVLPNIRVDSVDEGTAFGAAAYALWAHRGGDLSFRDATDEFLSQG